MGHYVIQRPATIWIETTVQADNLTEALELADIDFEKGEYVELYPTWGIDYDRYWTQDEQAKVEYV